MRRPLKRALAALSLLGLTPARAAEQPRLETAVLAGGCFWGVESVFEHVKGVEDVVSGYAGGRSAGLDRGGGGASAAEAVRIRFDPARISFEQILQIFFSVVHDPTQLNRQGPDVGERYRSAIFPQGNQQRAIAEHYLASLRGSKRFARPVVTRLETGSFQVADTDQQDFVRKHPGAPYVIVNDLPKLRQLRDSYPAFWKG